MKSLSWPRLPLLWRNVLEVAVWTVVVQSLVGVALFYMVQVPRITGLGRYAVQHAELVRTALASMDRPAADRYIVRANATGPTTLVRGPAPVEAGARPDQLVLRLFARGVAERIPSQYDVRWQLEPDKRLWLGFDVAGDKVWVGLAADAVLTEVGGALFAMLLLVAVIAVFFAWMIQGRFNRPLQRLIDASEHLARGAKPAPLPEQGDKEVVRLARTFNGMVESIDRAERDRALMLAGISHDLRTPLTKLRFALEYVGPHAEPDMLALMERNIGAADRIIDQFIDFARDGSDEAAQAVDLAELVREVVQSFEPLAQPISLDLAPLPKLRIRRTAMYRVVGNLLRNALDYAGTDIAVRTTALADGFALSVLDRGPGIPEGEAERLRQPFTRLDAARSGRGGSGLGLAIVDRVARLHGGALELLARKGGGLEARLVLPASVRGV